MVLVPSTMVPLGSNLPRFEALDVTTGSLFATASLEDEKPILVIFLCRHCPYVIHVQKELATIGREYVTRGVAIVAISSNDVDKYPEDSPDSLREMASDLGFVFPVCYDDTQEVARAFHAACTPDVFLYDANRRLVYRGQLDDSRPGNNIPVTGSDLRSALDAVLSGTEVSLNQKPNYGCNIKWKPQ
jgi:peroxiredoxin